MFFMFAFNAFLALVITYKLSNEFEKLYNNKKSDKDKVLDTEKVDLGIILLYIT